MQPDYGWVKDYIASAYETALSDGIPDAVARSILMRAEADLLKIERESAEMFRDLVKHCGTAVVSERRGVSRRTVQRWYADALNKSRHKTAA